MSNCEKCGSATHRDEAMNRRCNSCEHIVRFCDCASKYNGYANKDSHDFDVVWANSQPLYEAIKSHARAMRPVYQVMTYQTLGRNMKDAISAMINDGGWGWRSCPDEFVAVRSESIRLLEGIDIRNVNEEEFGAAILAALETD